MWEDTKLEGETYGHIECGYVSLNEDNYKDYLAFADEFGGLNNYPDYEWSGKQYTIIYGDGGAIV